MDGFERLLGTTDVTEKWILVEGEDRLRAERVITELPLDADEHARIERHATRGVELRHAAIEPLIRYEGEPRPCWIFEDPDALTAGEAEAMARGALPPEIVLGAARAVGSALAYLDRQLGASRARFALTPERVLFTRRGVRLRNPGFIAGLEVVRGGLSRVEQAFAAPPGVEADVYGLALLTRRLLKGFVDPELEASIDAALATDARRPRGIAPLTGAIDAALGRLGSGRAYADWWEELVGGRRVAPVGVVDPFDLDALLEPPPAFEEEEGTERGEIKPAVRQPVAARSARSARSAGSAGSAGSERSGSSVEDRDDPMLGSVLHGYRLESVLGMGSFARVYVGVHVHLERRAAIKLLRAKHAGSSIARRRLAREASALVGLEHPNVVRMLDFGETASGIPFLTTELLEGETLDALIRREGPLPPQRAAEIGAAIARGLSAAHKLSIVHRDLKPANVMLTAAGSGSAPASGSGSGSGSASGSGSSVKILDFGVASAAPTDATKLTAPDSMLGTPAYMAPEQIRGAANVGPSADLYSLGVVLHTMVTKSPPFKGSVADVIEAQLTAPPPPLPPLGGLERVITSLLAKQPEQRPRSAEEVAALLEPFAGLVPDAGATAIKPRPPDPDPPLDPTRALPARARWPVPSLVSLAIAILALIIALLRRA